MLRKERNSKKKEFYFDRKDYERLLEYAEKRGLSIAEARMVAWLVKEGKLSVEDAERIINAEKSRFVRSVIKRGVKKEQKRMK